MQGFKNGFSLEYQGSIHGIRRTSQNLPFRIGDEKILWSKVMKEVKLGRFAGPFLEPPYEFFIQSPIGLVPKDNGKQTRLIFHLSHPRGKEKLSINSKIPSDLCSVTYPEFEDAIELCQLAGSSSFAGKSDMQSAFRNLPMQIRQFCLLLMKARHPISKIWYYLIDKCLPFGSSISCKIFQDFSDSISHLVRWGSGRKNINYLDDFFFVALVKALCDSQVNDFLTLCKEINFPVSMDKTFWGSQLIVFLGLLIDTINQVVCIPVEKVQKAREMLTGMLANKRGKATIQQIQRLTG